LPSSCFLSKVLASIACFESGPSIWTVWARVTEMTTKQVK
jgi:hypothetical protein